MLKYVAIIQVTDRNALGSYRTGRMQRNFKSPTCDEEKAAKDWLKKKLKEYPESQNIVSSGIIALDVEKSENAENMLESLMHVL